MPHGIHPGKIGLSISGAFMETSASLLERLLNSPDEATWQCLDELYRLLMRPWLLRDPSVGEEAEDVVQEAMGVLVRALRDFQRQRNGLFRRWLRIITAPRLGAFYRSRQNRPVALASPLEDSPLMQPADPHSELGRQWNREHDRYVLNRLIELIAPLFEPTTLAAF
jgi:RNA polymerase sigma-70 factor (ECF subfamily)